MPPETVLPSKLPSYHPPAVMRIQTPSPPPAPGNINNSVVAAIGCEIIVRDMIPTQGHKKCGTSDEVEKAASKLGTEVDAMHKELDDMHRRTRQGFAAANQKFDLMTTNMSVLTSTLSMIHTQLQSMTHTMLGQREEKMISDKAHTIDMRLFDLERMLDKAQTNEDKISISAKIKHLEEAREGLHGEYKYIGTCITSMLTGPIHTALPTPPLPPGFPNHSMPPPSLPHPSTPTSHQNNIVPPTPTGRVRPS